MSPLSKRCAILVRFRLDEGKLGRGRSPAGRGERAEALRIGLVGRVVPANELLDAALDLAARLARSAPLAVRLAKNAIYRGLQQDFATALEWAATAESITLTSENHQEGLAANRERRPPRFHGR